MKLTRFLLAPVLALALASPALAEKIPLAELSRYLNSLGTVQADFTQVNSDGSISTGVLYIKRPGRARFEYKSDKTLVLASGGQVAIFDPKSNQPPEQYPLAKTPLNLILGQNINLGRAKMVTGYRQDGAKTIVTAQDPDHPEYGNIQLVFTASPTELRQWVVTDNSGQRTTVILSGLKPGADPGASKFAIHAEIARRK